MLRQHGPLSWAVKLTRIGLGAGPMLSQALAFAKLLVEMLVEDGCPGHQLPRGKKSKSEGKAHASSSKGKGQMQMR